MTQASGQGTTVYVLNGPNLNLLGLREPEIYGSQTLDDIAGMLEDRGRELGLEIDMRQSNHEGHLIDWLHEAQAEGVKAVLLNAGAYTHTSVAIHDRGSPVEPAQTRGFPPPFLCRHGRAWHCLRLRRKQLPCGIGRRFAPLKQAFFHFH